MSLIKTEHQQYIESLIRPLRTAKWSADNSWAKVSD